MQRSCGGRNTTDMFRNIFRRRVLQAASLFNGYFIDPKAVFLASFDSLPSVSYLGGLNIAEAVPWLRKAIDPEVSDILRHAEFNPESGRMEFNLQYYVLNKPCIVEVGAEFVCLYHERALGPWATGLLRELSAFRRQEHPRPPIGFGSRYEREN